MKTSNKEILEDFYATVFNGHEVGAAEDFIADDYIQHNPTVEQGLEGFINFFSFFFAVSPDAQWEILDIIAEDDKVVVYSRAYGTYSGPFGDATVDGASYDFTLVDIFRVEDSMLVEHWDVIDNLTFFTQLGVLGG